MICLKLKPGGKKKGSNGGRGGGRSTSAKEGWLPGREQAKGPKEGIKKKLRDGMRIQVGKKHAGVRGPRQYKGKGPAFGGTKLERPNGNYFDRGDMKKKKVNLREIGQEELGTESDYLGGRSGLL